MPLSEHEQRLLDQIEQALYAEDPKFAANVRSVRRRTLRRRWVPLSIIGVLGGLAVVIVGLAAKQIAVGVVGFVLIVASCVYAASMLSHRNDQPPDSKTAQPRAVSRSQGLRSRMEDRLRRRFDEN